MTPAKPVNARANLIYSTVGLIFLFGAADSSVFSFSVE
jgi:hypothetical protein